MKLEYVNSWIGILISVMITFSLPSSFAQGRAPWVWEFPLPMGESMTGIAYGHGLYVASGFSGKILISTDGQNWRPRISGVISTLQSVCFGEDRFVMVGNQGSIVTSERGLRWRPMKSANNKHLYAVVHGDHGFVAVGESGTAVFSQDGNSWSFRQIAQDHLYGLHVVNGQYYAVGANGAVVVSSDGQTWSGRFSGTTKHLRSIGGNGNVLVAVGDRGTVLVSSDGLEWNSVGVEGIIHWSHITFADGRFVIVGQDGSLASSFDGFEWTSHLSGTFNTIRCVTYGNGRFVAGCAGGPTLVSEDGENWGARSFSIITPPPMILDVARHDDLYVAVGNSGMILTSPDANHWQVRPSGTRASLSAIIHDGNRWLASGGGTLLSSNDGAHWNQLPPNLSFVDLLPHDDFLIGVGSDGIWTSSNGLEWVQADFSHVVALARGNGILVGVHTGAEVSNDGLIWERASIPGKPGSTSYYKDIVFGKNRFVAVGLSGLAAVSENGVDWEALEPFPRDAYSVLYDGASFVAAGNRFIAISPDGFEWQVRDYGSKFRINAMIYDSENYLAVASHAKIALSKDALGWAWQNMNAYPRLRDIVIDHPISVAVGEDGLLLSKWETDPWQPFLVDYLSQNGYTDFQAVAGGHGTYVAVGTSGIIVSSKDGRHWRKASEGGEDFNDVAYGNNRFIAVGDKGWIAQSDRDGQTWSRPFSGTTTDLGAVVFVNDRFLASGENKRVLASSDGSVWETLSEDGPSVVNSMASGNGRLVATSRNPRSYVSEDNGVTWEDSQLREPLFDVVFGGNVFLAAGRDGGVFTSRDGLTWKRHQSATNNDLHTVTIWNGKAWVGGDRSVLLRWQPSQKRNVIRKIR